MKIWLFAAAVVCALVVRPTSSRADAKHEEETIRALNDTFVAGFVARDAKKRASIFAEDATLVPPTGGFFRGRDAIAGDFETEIPSVTDHSKMSFSNYRFRFLTPDVALVDADITINNVIGPDSKLHPVVGVSATFVAVRKKGKWWIQDERAYFKPTPPEKPSSTTVPSR